MKKKAKPVKISIPWSGPFPHNPNDIWHVTDDRDMRKSFDIRLWHLFTNKGMHAIRFAVDGRHFEIYFYKSGRQIWVIPCQEKKKGAKDDKERTY